MMNRPQTEHLSGYQARDHEIVDYRMYELEGTGLRFRGPPPDSLVPGSYFTCIGAAQTFGCFCEHPFPVLLARQLDLPVLNLGYGGAGPEFFARQEALEPFINQGRFVIIQVMSGRSQSNSLFESGGLEYLTRREDGKRMGANEAYQELLAGPAAIRRLLPGKLMARLSRLVAARGVRRIIEETRRAWIESHRKLLGRIRVPTILFWFSKRDPAYAESLRSVGALFGDFPQLITEDMVSKVREHCDYYVECVTRRGSPQRLLSRFSGEPVSVDPALDRPDLRSGGFWSHNRYYPSPEMHEDASRLLEPICRQIVTLK